MIHYRRAWRFISRVVVLLAAVPLFAAPLMAQGSGGPLNFEGLHQQKNQSAASRAFGGVTLARGGDTGLMFINPSSLPASGLQVSIAGARQYQDLGQEQHFAPVRYYPNLSLILEGMTDQIPDPDPDLIGFTPADTVQRPFDDITPNWSRTNSNNVPLHALVAVPVSFNGLTLTAGLGAVQYANLDHYYQNNNVLDPEVLAQRPLPTIRPTDDEPITVGWYQASRSREGSINGYGAALAGHMERYNLTIGVSGLLLNGSSDDVEERVSRGELTFFANEFRADSSAGRLTRIGTSEFSGTEFTISSTLSGEFVSIGVVVKPPTTYDRSYEMTIEGDTAGTPISASVSEQDELQLPWRGSVGMLLKPRERLTVGLEYELRPYASATFIDAEGEETLPWESSSLFRVGAEYDLFSWLALRGGIRGEADVFVPDGSAITSDPVTYRVYSAGLGFNFYGVHWNVTYENASMKYQDVWGSALSRNWDTRHAIVTDISVRIPTGL